jgi:signal transduction histidine kinase/DNA-binding NarL/FixJ family response regulator
MTVQKTRFRFIIMFVMICLAIAAEFVSEQIFSTQLESFVNSTEKVFDRIAFEDQLDKLRNDITLVQARVRGFIITEDPVFIDSIQNEIHQIAVDMRRIQERTYPEAYLRPFVDTLSLLVTEKVQHNYYILETLQQQGKPAAENIVRTGKGMQLRSNIYRMIDRISEVKSSLEHGTTNRLMLETQAEKEKLLWQNKWVPRFITTLFVLLALGVFYILYRNLEAVRELEYAKRKETTLGVMKDQFMANITHEIRTPLNSIIGYTNLLDSTGLSEAQRRYVRAVRVSGDLLSQIVNNVLDFSKLNAGVSITEKVEFRPFELLANVKSTFEDAFGRKGVLFRVIATPSLPEQLAGDVLKLRQILNNLIGNSLKFTEQGSVEVVVSSQSQVDRICWLQFVVKDTGIGIEKAKLARIFERFFQSSETRSRNYGGAGLGLSITQRLIELMGGKIQVSSEPGKGSVFTVILPFERVTEPRVSEFSLPSPNGGGKRILVVDDNSLNRELVEQVLTSWDFQVTTVESGAEALAVLKTQSFEAVLLDIQMPQMDGYEVISRIRNELAATVPVIALSAYASTAESERCKLAGFRDFVSKPFNELELYGVICRATDIDRPILNLEYVQKLSKGNRAFEGRLIGQVLEQLPNQLSRLYEAIQKNDLAGIATLMHDLHAELSIFSLQAKLAEEFSALRDFTNRVPGANAEEAFKTIDQVCHQLLDELKMYV